MIIRRNFEKEYPEPPECEVNGSQCEFDLECICHECGEYLCQECTTYIRHQPRLSKYVGRILTDQGPTRAEAHCDECRQSHVYSPRNVAIGSAIVLLGAGLIFIGSDLGAVAHLFGVISDTIRDVTITPQVIPSLSLVQLTTLGISGVYVLSVLWYLLSADPDRILSATLVWVVLLTVLNVTSILVLMLGWFGTYIGYRLIMLEYRLKKPVNFSIRQVV